MEAQPTVRNPSGAERMKKIVVSALFMLLCAATAGAFDTTVMELQAQRLRSQIELQIEQIRRAREVADYRVGQRLAHLEAQLKLSEEDLERRVEELKALQQSLRGQMESSGSGIVDAQNQLKKTLEGFYSDIQNQIHRTTALINKVRSIRQGLTSAQGTGLMGPEPIVPAHVNSDTGYSSISSGPNQYNSPGTCSSCGGQGTYQGTSLEEIERTLAELQNAGTSTDSSYPTQPATSSGSGSCPYMR